ncbi:hypothetical protein F7D13_08620 [Methylocystis rosea]|uniref:RiboL-PSP-HEPN domain-containing protein n=1 Tax=Methylocystis rosea TaxID=173366 RepID=A0ABX6EKY5_9HYPH|nr:hypothetical protein [Methylocystis rosea]QGM94081.1 hypothetical protein F7D13_08620 [Methylocystis rosea]
MIESEEFLRHVEELKEKRYASRDRFIFGEPPLFFEPFEQRSLISSPIAQTLLSFKSNLNSAIQVGSIPYRLAHASILDQRFAQLHSAERIRALKGSEDKSGTESPAHETARLRMSEELKDGSVIMWHACRTLDLLDKHINEPEFDSSASELLNQVIVMTWGAFETLVNDSIRFMLNEHPSIVSCFVTSRTNKDALIGRNFMLDALQENNFDLSKMMGDIVCNAMKFDSIGKIRDAVRSLLNNDEIDTSLKNTELWLVSQRRHLIVHKRAVIDSSYIANTTDNGQIGEKLSLKASYVEESLVLVRDIGLAFFDACVLKHQELK